MAEPLLTPAEVAKRCHVSTKTVLRAIRAGRLRASRLGDRCAYRIRPQDIDAWIEESTLQPTPAAPVHLATLAPPPLPPAKGRLALPTKEARQ